MKVMKFGGTSVGSVNSILSVKRIVESASEPVIVVVSALGGITDKLINTSKMAAAGDSAYEGEFREIVYRHVEMIKEVIPAGAGQVALQRQIGELLNELKDIFQGIYLIRDLSPKTSDTIVSYGERLSSIIVAELIDEAKWFDSRTFIKTEKKHNKHTIDADLTNQLVKEAFHSIPKVSLVPGFISSDKVSGDVTNLGRGGSDYTAAIIAAALDAGSLEIWTDVDGFMTADPRVISTAYTISELSYVEATELCNFGAKVVYPPTIYPVCHKNIPIIIKNTFNPDGVGTVIKQETSNPQSKGPNPWDLLQPQDVTSRHRGAKPLRRYELLGGISLLSPEYLLSFERCPFHTETPDHYALVSYLIDLSVSQSSALMPLHSNGGYQSP